MPNLILYAIVSAVILGAIGGLVYKIDSGGYNRCQSEHKEDAQKAEDRSNVQIEEIRALSEKRLKEINDAPITDEEHIIAPVLRDVLDGLHERHGTDQ